MRRIDSASNEKIKFIASLRHRKYREREGLFIAEGVRLAEMAAYSGWDVPIALVTGEAAGDSRAMAALDIIERRGGEVFLTSEQAYKKAAATVTPQGLLAVVRRRRRPLSEITLAASPLVAVLDGVQNPGNAGAAVRCADASGCSGLVTLGGTADLFSEKAVRASMGSVFYLPVYDGVTDEEFMSFARESGMRLFVTAVDGTALPYYDADFTGGSIVVFGNEGAGAREIFSGISEKVFIPMAGAAQSLNVTAAAAVVLFGAMEQRRRGGFLKAPPRKFPPGTRPEL